MTVEITFPGNLAQVGTADDLRQVGSFFAKKGDLYIVTNMSSLFAYDPSSVAVDDGVSVIKPNDRTSLQAGRWIVDPLGFSHGPAGPAFATFFALANFKAAPTTNATQVLQDPSIQFGTFNWTLGDFSATPAPDLNVNVIQANGTSLTTGAWVRQLSSGIAFQAAGTGAVRLDQQSKSRQTVSTKDFGAVGSGFVVAAEAPAVEAAITAVRNTGDASFSGQVDVPNGFYKPNRTIQLPASYALLSGSGGASFGGVAGQHVFQAQGASFVNSKLRRMRLYGGLDGIRADTTGEIATLLFEDITVGSHTGNAYYFANGLTSSKLIRAVTDGGTHAIWCAGGLNNNNVVSDADLNNASDDVIRIDGYAQAWQFRNVHIEGNGQAGKTQYNLTNPLACHILGGWSEAGHEYFLRATTTDPNNACVIIDGLTSIGSQYTGSGGLVGSKFDVGQMRVIFGSNALSQPTIAPARCFISGVNKNLITDNSVVHTRALKASEHAVSRKRSFAALGDQTFSFLHLTRGDTSNVGTNQQVVSVTMFVTLSGYDSGGVGRWGVWRVEMAVHALGNTIDDPNSTITTTLVQGNLGAITLSVQKSTATTASDADLQMVFAGVNTGLNNYVQYEMNMRNMSSTETGRFAISVL